MQHKFWRNLANFKTFKTWPSRAASSKLALNKYFAKLVINFRKEWTQKTLFNIWWRFVKKVSCFPDVSFWQTDQKFEQFYWRQKFPEGHQLPRCPEFKLGPPVTTTGLLHHQHHPSDRFLGKQYSSNNKQVCVDGCNRAFRKISRWPTIQKTKSGREFKE